MRNSITKGARQIVKILCTEKHNIFVTVYVRSQRVKQAWPAESRISTPTLLMRSPAGGTDISYKAKVFSFADVQSVTVSIPIL